MKSLCQALWDIVGIPFRYLLFDQQWLPLFHWTTLEQERINAVLPHIKGRLLDIGTEFNNFLCAYEETTGVTGKVAGIGVDIFEWVHPGDGFFPSSF